LCHAFAELQGSCIVVAEHFSVKPGVHAFHGHSVALFWLVEVGQHPQQQQQQQHGCLPAWLLRWIREDAGFGPLQQTAVINAMETFEEIDLKVSWQHSCFS
jgi:hypothetical protein